MWDGMGCEDCTRGRALGGRIKPETKPRRTERRCASPEVVSPSLPSRSYLNYLYLVRVANRHKVFGKSWVPWNSRL